MHTMRTERFFKHDLLPFAEMRYSQGSRAPFKMHMHQTLSIGAVDEGEVFYRVEDEEAFLRPGSLAVMNPETLHACNPVSGAGRSYSMLYLDTGWCTEVQQSLWETDCFIPMGKIRIDDDALYGLYCHTMAQLVDEQVHLQQKEQLIFDLAVQVFTHVCSPQQAETCTIEDHTVVRLKRLLAADLQDDLPIAALAADLGVNPYSLIRRFKSLTGITPHAYRMNCRIEQAKRLLRKGGDIGDTALVCGFFDQSHFHRTFKAMTTVTPLEYRVNFVQ